jgi:anti-sigma regulatory factor (Ser/Thr protein kinase)
MATGLIMCDEEILCDREPIDDSSPYTSAYTLLARAETPAERKLAVTAAMNAGMPLHEIEEELDCADATRKHQTGAGTVGSANSASPWAQADKAPDAVEFVFVLPNDQERIAPVVEFLATEATRLAACDSAEQMRISLALEEALVNALYHGNLEIDSDTAVTAEMCRHDVAKIRRCERPYCDRHIRVLATIATNAAVFVIRDEGRGFDPNRLSDPTSETNLERCSGRGVFLMRSLMDRVIFNEIGNEVTMIRRWAA